MTAERNAREVIDRMAAAMAHEKGRDWRRMTAARQDQLRAQARAALAAFRPAEADGDEDIAVVVARECRPSDPVTAILMVEAWVDEVLRPFTPPPSGTTERTA